jgi:hypothetical protein
VDQPVPGRRWLPAAVHTLTPVDPRGIHKGAFWPFHLTLWCEDDQQPHPWPAASYTFTRDKDWWVRVAPHAMLVVRILRHVLQVATPALTVPLPVDTLKEAKADLDAMGKLLDQSSPLRSWPRISPTSRAVASGTGCERCGVLLGDLGRNRTFGDLNVVTTSTRDVLWICPIHYPSYVPPRPVL